MALLTVAPTDGADRVTLQVVPERIEFSVPETSEQVLARGVFGDGSRIDWTRQAEYAVVDPTIAGVTKSGRVSPLRDGQTELTVRVQDQESRIPIVVRGMTNPIPVSFEHDIIPILSKAGCNAGGCHGKAEGQNGFKLSVFGYDPQFDHQAIVMAGRGRRVFPASPDKSLFLLKATAIMPHGGGQKVEPESRWHQMLRRWIREGARFDSDAMKPASAIADSNVTATPPASPTPATTANPVATANTGVAAAPPSPRAVVSIAVEPLEVTLPANGSQQLRVTARQGDGTIRCVTVESEFKSNNDAIAGADSTGLIEATDVPGEAAILVRYLGHVAVCRVTRPRNDPTFTRPPEKNFVDRLVADKLERLRITPSPVADDATYLRRVYLDTIGTLPTVSEARRFLADTSPEKRTRLAAELLERPEYSDYWAQRWADLLQADKDTITPQGVVALTRWVRRQIANNVPYDQFVRSIVTAQGSSIGDSPAAFFQVQSDPEKAARAISQLFLGVRIECAQCHHHPFERWDQQDYFALAGLFSGIDRRPGPAGSVKVVDTAGSDLKHPRTGQAVPAAGLGAAPANVAANAVAAGGRRRAFADWATSSQNPYFTRVIVNRIWAHYFGRGLVEQIDDLRATNPPSNEPLLDALTAHLIELRYDLRAFTRTLLSSNAYQFSSQTTPSNESDDQSYSHASWRPLPAEVLLDAVSQVTGVPEEFNGWPRGYRAIQVWDNKLPSDFLAVFGRPSRQTVCACERGTEPSIAQALHLMNSTNSMQKIVDRHGVAAKLAKSNMTPQQIIEELYLATLSRFPQPDEQAWMLRAFEESTGRAEAVEDVLWTLINSKEFVFNH